jgi:cytoskeleton protein RodZ
MAVRNRRAETEPAQAPSNVIEAPIVPRPLTVSDILRDRRIEYGLDIGNIADILRIRRPVLEAIENGNFDQLPGPAYAVGFVRAYAAYLGLDAETLVIRFKAEAAEMSRRPHLSFPLPMRDSHVPTKPLLIVCLLLATLTYGGWYYFSAEPERLSELTPLVPERLRQLLTPFQMKSEIAAASKRTDAAPVQPTPEAEAASPGPVSTASPAQALPTQPAVAPPAQASAQTPNATPQGEADGVPPVESRPGAAIMPPASNLPAVTDLAQPSSDGDAGKSPAGTYGAPDAEAHVVLHANSDSWIEVRDNRGNLIFTRVLKAGEHYNVPAQAGLTLIAGNAGGLDITVDGRSAAKLGDPGRVVRNVSLDAERLLSTTAHAN